MLHDFFKEGFTILPGQLLGHFKDYKVSPQAFLLLIYLIEREQKDECRFSLPALSNQYGWSEPVVHQFLNELVTQNLIEFKVIKDGDGKQEDTISLAPLYKKLESYYVPVSSIDILDNVELDLAQYDLVPTFQKEFKTNLTHLQLIEIAKWQKEDGFPDAVILLALQQAVLNDAVSMRYIDKILLEWKKKGIKTLEEAKAEIERRNLENLASKQGKTSDEEPFIPFEIPKIKWN